VWTRFYCSSKRNQIIGWDQISSTPLIPRGYFDQLGQDDPDFCLEPNLVARKTANPSRSINNFAIDDGPQSSFDSTWISPAGDTWTNEQNSISLKPPLFLLRSPSFAGDASVITHHTIYVSVGSGERSGSFLDSLYLHLWRRALISQEGLRN